MISLSTFAVIQMDGESGAEVLSQFVEDGFSERDIVEELRKNMEPEFNVGIYHITIHMYEVEPMCIGFMLQYMSDIGFLYLGTSDISHIEPWDLKSILSGDIAWKDCEAEEDTFYTDEELMELRKTNNITLINLEYDSDSGKHVALITLESTDSSEDEDEDEDDLSVLDCNIGC